MIENLIILMQQSFMFQELKTGRVVSSVNCLLQNQKVFLVLNNLDTIHKLL